MTNYKQFLSECKEELQRDIGKRDVLLSEVKKSKRRIKGLKNEIVNTERAREVIQSTVDEIQRMIEYRIGNLVTMALQTIFDDRYVFTIRFIPKRGKMEAELVLTKDDIEMTNILESSGGGLADIVSFTLRVSIWAMKKNRPLFILDEPFKSLSPDRFKKCTKLLNNLSTELGIQFIIINPHTQSALTEGLGKIIFVKEGEDIIETLKRRKQ